MFRLTVGPCRSHAQRFAGVLSLKTRQLLCTVRLFATSDEEDKEPEFDNKELEVFHKERFSEDEMKEWSVHSPLPARHRQKERKVEDITHMCDEDGFMLDKKGKRLPIGLKNEKEADIMIKWLSSQTHPNEYPYITRWTEIPAKDSYSLEEYKMMQEELKPYSPEQLEHFFYDTIYDNAMGTSFKSSYFMHHFFREAFLSECERIRKSTKFNTPLPQHDDQMWDTRQKNETGKLHRFARGEMTPKDQMDNLNFSPTRNVEAVFEQIVKVRRNMPIFNLEPKRRDAHEDNVEGRRVDHANFTRDFDERLHDSEDANDVLSNHFFIKKKGAWPAPQYQHLDSYYRDWTHVRGDAIPDYFHRDADEYHMRYHVDATTDFPIPRYPHTDIANFTHMDDRMQEAVHFMWVHEGKSIEQLRRMFGLAKGTVQLILRHYEIIDANKRSNAQISRDAVRVLLKPQPGEVTRTLERQIRHDVLKPASESSEEVSVPTIEGEIGGGSALEEMVHDVNPAWEFAMPGLLSKEQLARHVHEETKHYLLSSSEVVTNKEVLNSHHMSEQFTEVFLTEEDYWEHSLNRHEWERLTVHEKVKSLMVEKFFDEKGNPMELSQGETDKRVKSIEKVLAEGDKNYWRREREFFQAKPDFDKHHDVDLDAAMGDRSWRHFRTHMVADLYEQPKSENFGYQAEEFKFLHEQVKSSPRAKAFYDPDVFDFVYRKAREHYVDDYESYHLKLRDEKNWRYYRIQAMNLPERDPTLPAMNRERREQHIPPHRHFKERMLFLDTSTVPKYNKKHLYKHHKKQTTENIVLKVRNRDGTMRNADWEEYLRMFYQVRFARGYYSRQDVPWMHNDTRWHLENSWGWFVPPKPNPDNGWQIRAHHDNRFDRPKSWVEQIGARYTGYTNFRHWLKMTNNRFGGWSRQSQPPGKAARHMRRNKRGELTTPRRVWRH